MNDCSAFPFCRVASVDPQPPEAVWLIQDLWLLSGVGILGGEPKLGKTFLAVEFAFAVATGLPALGCYKTHQSGPVLFYCAEGSISALRARFDGIALARSFDIQQLNVFLIDVPVIQLDKEKDLNRLHLTIEQCRPKLLILDPFVRLMGRTDENSSAEVSEILAALRTIQRTYDLAILLVHHARKSPASIPALAFRGSSDFAAWSDSNLFLARRNQQLVLILEHRSAESKEPILLSFVKKPAVHFVPIQHATLNTKNDEPPLDPVEKAIQIELESVSRPLTTVELRQRLRRRKSDVILALDRLRIAEKVQHTSSGWKLLSAPLFSNSTQT
jgi:RecA-family ATPase